MASKEGRIPRPRSGPPDISSVVRYFRRAESTKVRGNVNLSLHLASLETTSQEEGLAPKHIIQLLDVAASGTWPVSVSTKLIRSLIPKQHVPVEAALKAISWMCTNSPSAALQTLMIRWLVLVYELIDRKEDLQALYGIVFYMMENDSMRPHVCHLLYLMTRKEDVRPFRIRALVRLQQSVGPQPYIQGLLSIYKLYCPQLVAIAIPSTRKVFFRQLDRAWGSLIRTVQSKNAESRPDHTSAMDSRLSQSLSATPPAKRRRKFTIPKAQEISVKRQTNMYANSSSLTGEDTPLPLSSVTSFEEFLQNIHRLELPSRAACAVENEFVCNYGAICGDRALPHRLSYWIHHALQEEFFHRPRSENLSDRQSLLDCLLYFTKFLQEGIPVVENFLSHYLHVWNGKDHRDCILQLITHLNLYPFDALRDLILKPLHKLFFASSVYFKCQILWCLKDLVRNYAMLEWHRHIHTLELQEDRRRLSQDQTYMANHQSMFRDEVEGFSGLATIEELIKSVNEMVGVALMAEKDHELLMHCCLDFYEMVACLAGTADVPVVCMVPNNVGYRFLFAGSALSVSRLCKLMTSYRTSLDHVRKIDRNGMSQEMLAFREHSVAQIAHFNQYTLDIASTVWQGRAFKSKHPKSVYSLFKEELAWLREKEHQGVFSAYRHPALVVYAWMFYRETQKAGKRVDLEAVKAHKHVYLEFMYGMGLKGISQFVQTFVRDTSLSSPSSKSGREASLSKSGREASLSKSGREASLSKSGREASA